MPANGLKCVGSKTMTKNAGGQLITAGKSKDKTNAQPLKK